MLHGLVVAGVILPLALDTFALSAALGMAGLPQTARRRTSLFLATFEAVMPILGTIIGATVGGVIGRFAGWTAIAVLVLAGALMLRPGDEQKDAARLMLLARARGLAIVDLGVAVSLDEVAVGFSLGLVGLSLPVAVAWIGIQAFVAAEIGLRLGSRIADDLRERAEQIAGAALIAVAALLLALKLFRGGL